MSTSRHVLVDYNRSYWTRDRLERWPWARAVLLGTVSLGLHACVAPGQVGSKPLETSEVSVSEPRLLADVRVDHRVELFSIIFRLAGAKEFSGSPVSSYATAVDEHFNRFADHPAVTLAKQLRATDGISFNAVPELAVHAGALPLLEETVSLDQANNLDKRWKPQTARAFLAAAREFARASEAEEFLTSQRPLFTVLERRMRNLVSNEADLDWIRNYYGGRSGDRYFIVPALLAAGGNYGPAVSYPDGRRDLYAVLGVAGSDDDGNPTVSFGQASTLVHEFGHSFVNPLVYSKDSDLRPIGEEMLRHSRDAMRTNGYPEPLIVVHETIIRAGVARYKLAHFGEVAAERELDRQRKLGFIWIKDVYDLLGRYEAERAQYPTLADFYPVLKQQFDLLTARLPTIVTAYDQTRPKIIEMIPAIDGKMVDPSISELRVRFDRPMERQWGFDLDVAANMPEVTGIKLEENDTVMVIGVSLKPNTSYAMPFFASSDYAPRAKKDGTLLGPTTLRFATGPASRRRRTS